MASAAPPTAPAEPTQTAVGGDSVGSVGNRDVLPAAVPSAAFGSEGGGAATATGQGQGAAGAATATPASAPAPAESAQGAGFTDNGDSALPPTAGVEDDAAAAAADQQGFASTSASRKPPVPEAATEVRGTVTQLGGRTLPPQVSIPHNAAKYPPFREVYLWRVVDKVSDKLVGSRQERVWIVTAAFTAVCALDGTLHRLSKLEDVELCATQSQVKKKGELQTVLLKFREAASEPSLVLELKRHKLNPANLGARECLAVLAACRLAQCRASLPVEALPEKPPLRSLRRLGPFAKAGMQFYQSPSRKLEELAEQSERRAREPGPRAFHGDGGGGGGDGGPLEALPTQPQVSGIGDAFYSPLAGAATHVAWQGKGTATATATAQGGAAVGDAVRVSSAQAGGVWRVGVVADVRDGVPLVSVGGAAAAPYARVERIQDAGVYRAVRAVAAYAYIGADAGAAPVGRIEAGRRVRVRALEDCNGAAWASLPSGRWVRAAGEDGTPNLEFVASFDEAAVDGGFGLHSGMFGTDPALEADLEPPPPVDDSGSVMRSVRRARRSSVASAHGQPQRPPSPVDDPSPISVVVRVRPPIRQEPAGTVVAQGAAGPHEVVCRDQGFVFDSVLWSAAPGGTDYAGLGATAAGGGNGYLSQADVLSTVAPRAVDALLAGYNACVLAYGASGSGKTFTILGEGETPGLLQHTLSGILSRLGSGHTATVSFFELYAEKVKDLLAVATVGESANVFKKQRVRLHPITGPYIEGVTQVSASSADLFRLVGAAKNMRATSATHGNSTSSRSHAIMQVSLVTADGPRGVAASCLSVVDLAGSERARRYRDDNMAEASQINLSLTVLRKVIDALLQRESASAAPGARATAVRPPYRESMLTFLLSESIGGNSVTTIIATVSPTTSAVDDTLATLRYAARARHIVNRVSAAPVDAVCEALLPSSPKVAHALQEQFRCLAQAGRGDGSVGGGAAGFGLASAQHDPSRAAEAAALYSCIAQSADGSRMLEAILEDVRRREREEVMLARQGARVSPPPPTPPGADADAALPYEDGTRAPSPAAAQHAQLVSPPPPTSEEDLVRQLARTLTSEQFRMLSPSLPRESLERLPVDPLSPPLPDAPRGGGGSNGSFVNAATSCALDDLPTTLLARDYAQPQQPQQPSRYPSPSPQVTRAPASPPRSPPVPLAGEQRGYEGGAHEASPQVLGSLSPSLTPIRVSPPSHSRMPRGARTGAGGGAGGNSMRFGQTLTVLSDLLAATGHDLLPDAVEAAAAAAALSPPAKVPQAAAESPSARINPGGGGDSYLRTLSSGRRTSYLANLSPSRQTARGKIPQSPSDRLKQGAPNTSTTAASAAAAAAAATATLTTFPRRTSITRSPRTSPPPPSNREASAFSVAISPMSDRGPGHVQPTLTDPAAYSGYRPHEVADPLAAAAVAHNVSVHSAYAAAVVSEDAAALPLPPPARSASGLARRMSLAEEADALRQRVRQFNNDVGSYRGSAGGGEVPSASTALRHHHQQQHRAQHVRASAGSFGAASGRHKPHYQQQQPQQQQQWLPAQGLRPDVQGVKYVSLPLQSDSANTPAVAEVRHRMAAPFARV